MSTAACILLQLFTTGSKLRKVLFLVLSVTFLFVDEIFLEPLNGFAPNSRGSHVWSLAQMTLKVKVTKDKKWHFRPFWRFMVDKTSLASSVSFSLLTLG